MSRFVPPFYGKNTKRHLWCLNCKKRFTAEIDSQPSFLSQLPVPGNLLKTRIKCPYCKKHTVIDDPTICY